MFPALALGDEEVEPRGEYSSTLGWGEGSPAGGDGGEG